MTGGRSRRDVAQFDAEVGGSVFNPCKRVGDDADAVPRHVPRHDRVGQLETARPVAAIVSRLLLHPAGAVHKNQCRPYVVTATGLQLDGIAECRPHPDPIADCIGLVSARVRDQRHAE